MTPNPPATDRVAAKSAAKARAVQMFQYIVMPMSHQAMINYFAEQMEAHARYSPGGEEPRLKAAEYVINAARSFAKDNHLADSIAAYDQTYGDAASPQPSGEDK